MCPAIYKRICTNFWLELTNFCQSSWNGLRQPISNQCSNFFRRYRSGALVENGLNWWRDGKINSHYVMNTCSDSFQTNVVNLKSMCGSSLGAVMIQHYLRSFIYSTIRKCSKNWTPLHFWHAQTYILHLFF